MNNPFEFYSQSLW
jgi:endonuclease/exonuclease/phosphatase (EEP) superfamily protein YafD